MSKQRRFRQVDVFTHTPTKGNGLAVILNAEGMPPQEMQDFAAWTNLAETTFLLPPDDPAADYRVKIFTPLKEMMFAGHPTLGSCAAWLADQGKANFTGRVVQECNIGLVEINVTPDLLEFAAPPTDIKPMPEETISGLATVLGIARDRVVTGVFLNNGPQWQILELKTAEDVLAVEASRVQWHEFPAFGIIAPDQGHDPDVGLMGPASGDHWDYEARNLSPSSGASEDPITGSMNAAIAQWLRQTNRLASKTVVRQGTVINRHGRVYIRVDDFNPNVVWIGGQVHQMIDGFVRI